MRLFPLALGGLLLLSCSKKSEPQAKGRELDAGVLAQAVLLDAGRPESASAVDAGPSYDFSGTVRGVVKLAKGKKLPLAGPILRDGMQPPSIAPCPPVDASDQKIVSRSDATGGLSPVHVALTGFRAGPPHTPLTHEIFIDACRLRPTLIGTAKGDNVKVTNRSETALIPDLPGQKFARGLMRGESLSYEPKVVQTKVQCSFGSYCGETLVITTLHSLYDVTTQEGFFSIENVPLDQELEVHAWHPLFKETSAKVKLSKSEPEKMVELLLEPLPVKAVKAPKR